MTHRRNTRAPPPPPRAPVPRMRRPAFLSVGRSQSNPVRYLPAFGGFCSYGISREIIWNETNLGPASNPDFWLIYEDQLYLFRRYSSMRVLLVVRTA